MENIKPSVPSKPGEPVISRDGHPIAFKGEITSIKKRYGAGENDPLQNIIASIIANGSGDFNGVTASNPDRHAVLYFDAAGPKDINYFFDANMFLLSGKPTPQWLKPYSFDSPDITSRLKTLRSALKDCRAERGGIHSVFINRIFDFIEMPIDNEKIQALVGELEKIAIEFGTAILCGDYSHSLATGGNLTENPDGATDQ